MGVYRANAADAAQFVRVLDRENVPLRDREVRLGRHLHFGHVVPV